MSVHHLLRESVLLTLLSGGTRIDRKALVQAIGNVVPVSGVDALGNLGSMSEWFVLFKTASSRIQFLGVQELKVLDQLFSVGEPYRKVKTIRLLNLPPGVTDQEIVTVASKWGGAVLGVEVERLPPPYEEIKTFVRRIRIRFGSRRDEDKVPVTVRLSGFTVSVQLEGRQKVCYRCRQGGHIKIECKALKCQRCYEIGHDDQDCCRRKSYASTVVSQPVVPTADDFRTPVTPVQQEGNIEGVEPTTAPPWVRQQRIRTCYACKKQGHVLKDCPQAGKTPVTPVEHTPINTVALAEKSPLIITCTSTCTSHSRADDPTTSPATVDASDGQGDPVLETSTMVGETTPAAQNNIDAIELEGHSEPQHAATTVEVVIDATINEARISSMLNIRELYAAYKETGNDLKRPFNEEMDRSLDSDIGADPKKPHLHDSSASMGEDAEEGEVTHD